MVAERSRAANLKISIDVMFIVRGSFGTSGANREDFKPQMDANKRKCNFWDPGSGGQLAWARPPDLTGR